MRDFARLIHELDGTTSTNAKIDALVQYFEVSEAADAAWAVAALCGRRGRRAVSGVLLRQWLAEALGEPPWIIEECYTVCGDLAETVSLLARQLQVDDEQLESVPLHEWMDDRIPALAVLDEGEKRQRIEEWWRRVPRGELFVLHKLITGAFRVGVSQSLVVRALERWIGHVPRDVITGRMTGDWVPSPAFFQSLIADVGSDENRRRPYPFFLATPVDGKPDALGPSSEFLIEWKWDGIRAQLMKRDGEVALWSRGQELITERFPEVTQSAKSLDDGTVLDGELLARDSHGPLPFTQLQRRIQRKRVGRKVLAEVPVAFVAYDLLEAGHEDIRSRPLHDRRVTLERVIGQCTEPIILSELVTEDGWDKLEVLREESRDRGVEGFMLKRRDSAYEVGRRRGSWWKWKIDPLTVDAVMLYAQAGHGRRANLHTDYTFAIWKGEELVPIAKAYSGLSDVEIGELDRWIRRNTRERFGPVRSVEPEQVFEIAFEQVHESTRHKSGIAVRFPRIVRWRRDKKAEDVDRLETLLDLVRSSGSERREDRP